MTCSFRMTTRITEYSLTFVQMVKINAAVAAVRWNNETEERFVELWLHSVMVSY